MAEKTITLQNTEEITAFCGDYDKNLQVLKKEYDVTVVIRDLDIKILGEESDVNRCAAAIESLLTLLSSGKEIDELNIRYAVSMAAEGAGEQLKDLGSNCVC
ncbi:MAG: hypothetical protein RR977_01920, partial [Oscillospiraceae bacterium]